MKDDLDNDSTDELVAIANSLFGTLPIIGTAISEVFKFIIPNQRIDRIASFLRKIDEKLSDFDRDMIAVRMKLDKYVDLFEDCLWATARALTHERIEYIANVFANGITDDETNIVNHKKLLLILNQLDDIDLIFTKYYVLKTWDYKRIGDFFDKNKNILNEPKLHGNSNVSDVDKREYVLIHKRHLYNIGILKQKSKKVSEKPFEVDDLNNLEATWQAVLLLKEIKMLPNNFPEYLYRNNESKNK